MADRRLHAIRDVQGKVREDMLRRLRYVERVLSKDDADEEENEDDIELLDAANELHFTVCKSV